MTEPTGMPVPASRLDSGGCPDGVDHDAGKTVAGSLGAEVFDLLRVASGLSSE